MMKTFRSLGRHQGEVLDESGRRIDYASGRQSVRKMKLRHGIEPERDPEAGGHQGLDTLLTGFEDESR